MKTLTPSRYLGIIAVVLAVLIGAAATYGAIYTSFQKSNQPVHYHANFALIIDGTRFDFSPKKYMEEEVACSVSSTPEPRERAHLHDGVADVVHVHAAQVTWQDFFTNIGFRIDAAHLITDTGTVYTAGSRGELHFILNGKAVSSPMNSYIKSEDRLLISYSSQSDKELITAEYPQVPATAHTYNIEPDPASCSGSLKRPFHFLFWK